MINQRIMRAETQYEDFIGTVAADFNAGQLDAWCKDSCGWLQKTFGKENVVSAVLHLDEKTPHIHATVVPIVRGERRKAKLERTKNAASGKRTYRTKKDRPRL